jgi:hypothetical protein
MFGEENELWSLLMSIFSSSHIMPSLLRQNITLSKMLLNVIFPKDTTISFTTTKKFKITDYISTV